MFFTLYFRQTTKIKLKRTFETVRKCLFNPFQPNSETKPSLLQTSKMESFAILVHGFQPIKARPQMSKRRCFEKYYSCDKALPEGVILEKPTIGDKYITSLTFYTSNYVPLNVLRRRNFQEVIARKFKIFKVKFTPLQNGCLTTFKKMCSRNWQKVKIAKEFSLYINCMSLVFFPDWFALHTVFLWCSEK